MSDESLSAPPSPRSVDEAAPAAAALPAADPVASPAVVEEPLPPATAVWSLDQLRRAASRWSLAADSGLLNYVKNFSDLMYERTRELDGLLNDLAFETDSSRVRLQSTFNSFLLLSHSQFIENRVYDDDEPTIAPSEPKPANAVADMTQEEAEALLLPKYKEAMAYGVEALHAWQKSEKSEDADMMVGGAADAPPPGLGPEDNNALLGHPHLIQAKNEYMRRPLPFVIGTRQFAEDEYAGLKFEDDAQFLEDERTTVDQSLDDSFRDGLSSDDEDAEFYSSDEDDGVAPPVGADGIPVPPPPPPPSGPKQKAKDKQSVEEDDSSFDDDDQSLPDEDSPAQAEEKEVGIPSSSSATIDEPTSTGAQEEDEETDDPKQPPKDLRAALEGVLAGQIGGAPKKKTKKRQAEPATAQVPSAQANPAEESTVVAQQSKPTPSSAAEDVPAFLRDDDEDGGLFSKANAKAASRYGTSIFDDEGDDSIFGSMSSSANKPAPAKTSIFADDTEALFPEVSKKATSVDASVANASASKKAASSDSEPKQAPKPDVPKVAEATKKKTAKSIFDEDDVDEDIFASLKKETASKAKTATAPSATATAKKTASLFDDPSDDITDTLPTAKPVDESKSKDVVAPAKKSSLWDDADDSLPVPKPAEKPTVAATAVPAKKAASSVFDDDADDFLKPQPKPVTAAKKSSIFGDSEDELFGSEKPKDVVKPEKQSAKATAVKVPETKPESKIEPAKSQLKSVFDDDDDDVFASITTTKTETITKKTEPDVSTQSKTTGKIADLQKSLKFNPAMMMPGSKAPKALAEDAVDDWDEDDDNTADSSRVASNVPVAQAPSIPAASRGSTTSEPTEPASSKPLVSVTQTRPKQSKRPPSRAQRGESAQASTPNQSVRPNAPATKSLFEENPQLSAGLPKATSRLEEVKIAEISQPKLTAAATDIFSDLPLAKPVVRPTQTASFSDDIFGNGPKVTQISTPTPTTDIFSEPAVPLKSPQPSGLSPSSSSAPVTPTPAKTTIFDDIFAIPPTSAVATKKPAASSSISSIFD